jgi:hypothetical protein
MGYYKQLEVESQVAPLHPVFAPRPKRSGEHVALTRKALRSRRKTTPAWLVLTAGGVFFFLVGFVAGGAL